MDGLFAIAEILDAFADCRFVGDPAVEVGRLVALRDLSAEGDYAQAIAWVRDGAEDVVLSSGAKLGLLLCSEHSHEVLADSARGFILSENPRLAFLRLLRLKFARRNAPGIEPTAFVHDTAVVGDGCYIGHHVVVEAQVRIGQRCEVLHGTVLRTGTWIGDDVRIGCNNTIGGEGFGYERDEHGRFAFIEHIGGVAIHDGARIHDNTCIDRGVLNDTVIGANSKIDNLVHIAHGVKIGENTLVIANAMIAGSTELGANSWIGPSSSVNNGLRLAENTFLGTGAVVVRTSEPGDVLVGNPARRVQDQRRWSALRKRLLATREDDTEG